MKIKKVTRTLYNFGNTIDIWSDGFLNYAMVMLDFFGVGFPSLFQLFQSYHSKICQLSRIYDWQHAVFPLAIDYHTKIRTKTYTKVETWILPQHQVDQCCFLLWVLHNPTIRSCKHAAFSTLDNANRNKKHSGKICQNFNTKSCLHKNYFQEHKYSNCNAKDHGKHACTKPKAQQLVIQNTHYLQSLPSHILPLFYQFLLNFPCNPALLRPNSQDHFSFFDITKALLLYSPFLLILLA